MSYPLEPEPVRRERAQAFAHRAATAALWTASAFTIFGCLFQDVNAIVTGILFLAIGPWVSLRFLTHKAAESDAAHRVQNTFTPQDADAVLRSAYLHSADLIAFSLFIFLAWTLVG